MSIFARMIVIAAFLGVFAIPGSAATAQTTPRYTLIDLGTFGGPNSYLDLPGQTMNAAGTVIFDPDTSTPDPYAPNCINPDCFVSHGGEWRHGTLTMLDSLPGGSTNAPFSINYAGLIAGLSQIPAIDPLTGFPEARAVTWQDSKIENLGTLPGGNESNAFVVNDSGLVAGPASNAKTDPYSCQFFICWGTETRAVIWQNGLIHDIGTLGGPDAIPLFMNNAGQIAGQSYTNFSPNSVTQQPTLDPFLWQNGVMRDLGTLGGTFGYPNGMNSHGQVVGQSDVAGDQTFHPFLSDGGKMIDLGTFGGDYGTANGINDAGHVVGWGTTPGNKIVHAFLWKNGYKTDLGVVPGDQCDAAGSVNARDQVVGAEGPCGKPTAFPFLWEDGSIYNLNNLVPPSNLHLVEAPYISDRGEIICTATLPNGDQRVALLIPDDLATSQGLTSNAPASLPAGSATARVSSPVRDELHPLQEDWRFKSYRLLTR